MTGTAPTLTGERATDDLRAQFRLFVHDNGGVVSIADSSL